MNEKRKTKHEKRQRGVVIGVLLLCGFSFFAFRVSLAQTTQPASQVQKWFDDLADTEPAVREDARTALLGMSRDQLKELKEIVRKSLPLAPAQAVVLHDVVVHVYLAGEDYADIPQMGFLGVMLAPVRGQLGAFPNAVITEDNAGVLITNCMPGFCGFRFLRAGDMVVGVIGPEAARLPSQVDLISAVSATLPGKKVRLRVLRQGRMVELAVPVSARPRAAGDPQAPADPQDFLNRRLNAAEEYWQAEFEPIVGGGMS